MKTLCRLVFALFVAISVGGAMWAGPAEAVKVKDLSTDSYITPTWTISPSSPAGKTVVTVDSEDSTNFEIKVGVSSFGSVQSDTQTSAIYGAGALLPANAGAGYRVEWSNTVYGWDSYDALGTSVPGSPGYWDVFAVNLNQTGYYWTQVIGGGIGTLSDPIITPDPAGNCVGTAGVAVIASSTGPCLAATANPLGGETWAWGALDYANNTFEGNIGSYTLTLAGTTNLYLSVVLDTATTPEADNRYPSFGAFNPLSEVPPPTLVPEPGTLLLLGSGLLGAAGYGLRRGRRRLS